MKKLIGLLLVLFAVGGTIIIVNSINQENNNMMQKSPSTEEHADWPTYNIDKVLNKSKLAALVEVKDIKDKKVEEGEPDATLATLGVKEVFYGNAPGEIILDQAIDPVSLNQDYILFLKKVGDYYYLVDGHSKVKEKNGKFEIKIDGLKGEFTQQEFKEKISLQIKKNES
jgi:hypothetical protein